MTEVARRSLELGIAEVRDGARLGDIGAAIQEFAEGEGCSVVRDFVGHGIGRKFHEAPQVLARRQARHGRAPQGRHDLHDRADGQHRRLRRRRSSTTSGRCVTADGSLSAQFEHTLVVTKTGCEVLTRRTRRLAGERDLPEPLRVSPPRSPRPARLTPGVAPLLARAEKRYKRIMPSTTRRAPGSRRMSPASTDDVFALSGPARGGHRRALRVLLAEPRRPAHEPRAPPRRPGARRRRRARQPAPRSHLATEKARAFHEKWVVGYGHASVAEHAVVHLAIENVEHRRVQGRSRTLRLGVVHREEHALRRLRPEELRRAARASRPTRSPRYRAVGERLFATYLDLMPRVTDALRARVPRPEGTSEAAHAAAIRAQACDLLPRPAPRGHAHQHRPHGQRARARGAAHQDALAPARRGRPRSPRRCTGPRSTSRPRS